MFGFGSRRRPESDPARRGGAAGVALTATSARAAQLPPGTGKPKPIPLGEHSDDLPINCRLGVKPVESGATGLARRAPHLVCMNYLNQLGTPRQWQVGRAVTTPEDAARATLSLIVKRLGGPDAVGLVLPPTLSASQVKTVARLATESGLAVRASASAPLATAAHHLDPDEDTGVDVVIVECDDFALTATRLHHDGEAVQQVGLGTFPSLAAKLWGDRLVDGLSDRCVRLCRRDPRDSATAEQALYDQIGPALERARAGLGTALTIRHDHWVQDLSATPADWEALAAPLAGEAAAQIVGFVRRGKSPRAVWLTHEAARLPGLLARLTAQSPEGTVVSVLPATAAAESAAALALRAPANRPHAADTLAFDSTTRPRPESRHLMGD